MHVADHHIAPGKKQWTWGNHEFGYAWDRDLTDADGPYIELMAGVYTDNQPDFSFLQPGETRTFSQYWYPIRARAPHEANLEAAVSLERRGRAPASASPSRGTFPARSSASSAAGATIVERTVDLAPGRPFVAEVDLPPGLRPDRLRLAVRQTAASSSRTGPRSRRGEPPPPATEPPPPERIATPTSSTSPACTSSSTATPRAGRRPTGGRRCGAIPATAAATTPWASGTCAAASWRPRSATSGGPRAAHRAQPNPRHGEARYLLGLVLRLRGTAAAEGPSPRPPGTGPARRGRYRAGGDGARRAGLPARPGPR